MYVTLYTEIPKNFLANGTVYDNQNIKLFNLAYNILDP